MGRDPYMIPLPILENFNLILSYKTYDMFINKPKAITKLENPENFSSDTNW